MLKKKNKLRKLTDGETPPDSATHESNRLLSKILHHGETGQTMHMYDEVQISASRRGLLRTPLIRRAPKKTLFEEHFFPDSNARYDIRVGAKERDERVQLIHLE